MSAIGNRELPIPDHIDVFHLQREMEPSDKTALQCVMEVDKERVHLEHEADELAANAHTQEATDRLMDIYDRLEELDVSVAEVKAAEILHGLGFTSKTMLKPVKDFSGGWRMRISLARALFLKPDLMLLDEPTNHLDLNACVWLEQYLKTYVPPFLCSSTSLSSLFKNLFYNTQIQIHRHLHIYISICTQKYIRHTHTHTGTRESW